MSRKPPEKAGKGSGKPGKRAGGRRRREPRQEKDPLAQPEDVAEDGQAAALTSERAVELAIAVRLAPPPEPALGLPDGNFALDAHDFTLSPIDFDLDPFDPWVTLREQHHCRLADPEAGEEGGGPAPGNEGDPP